MNRMTKIALRALAIVVVMPAAQAAELAEGTVIDGSNIDALQNDTFEGHTIKDLIPEKLGSGCVSTG